MKGGKIFFIIAGLALASALAYANYVPLRSDVLSDQPEVQMVAQDGEEVVFEVKIPGLDLLDGTLEGKRWDRVEIPGGGYELDLGAPETPHFTKLVAVPATSGFRAQFEALETRILPNFDLMPAQGKDPQDLTPGAGSILYDQEVYSRDAFYPEQRVMVGEPVVMRGLRLIPVRINPVQYNPVTKELCVATRGRVTVHFEGSDLRNVPTREPVMSRAWAKMMRSTMVNFDELGLDEQDVGSYMIVCENDPDLINNLLAPLIDWKKRKGHSVTVQTFSPGASNTTIKNYIQTAYNTWPTPPEYVLLFGDVDQTYALAGWPVSGYYVDQPYAELEGDDDLPDVSIGRLPADNSGEASMMVNKVLFYEKIPYTTSTDWFHQGVLIAGNAYSGISTIQLNRWIKTRMVERNYTRIDTFWYGMAGTVATTLTPAINNGVLYGHYRGNYLMENFNNGSIDNLTNGRKLPFIVTITCGTGGFGGSSESLMEHFVSVGTATTPKGAIAAVGTATINTHTRQNNTLSYGTFAGIFDDGLTEAGHALDRGKLELYLTYQANDPYSVSEFSSYAALAGDPGLELFTQAIQFMSCTVPDQVTLGDNALNLTVTENGVGPLEGATVCLFQAGTGGLQVVGLTDVNGQIELPLNVTGAGNVKVTITDQNFYPIVDSLDVIQAAVAVGYYSHTVDDDNLGGSSGDGDGVINPGEVVQLPTSFKNYGNTTTATGISITASESDDYATLANATQTVANLTPGATGNTAGSFLVTVAPTCPQGHTVRLNLATTSAQGSWDGLVDLSVVSYDVNVLSAVATGSDTLLSPAETANFTLNINNVGGKSATSLTAILTSLDSYVTVNDNSAAFGTVNVNSTASCSLDPFNLTAAANSPPGHQANLLVTFTANGATQTDTLTIPLGLKSASDPQGPDEYGYYCFDNTDLNYAQLPTYNWVELDPSWGGTGSQLALNDPYENQDMSLVLSLPFTFRYYGQDVTQVTICSNGWLSVVANNSFADFRNYTIPSPIGPYGMIAPFWDDLVTWDGGHVYAKDDAANHRIIIEWSRMKNLNFSLQQTFEVILYDPAYYTTPTGDSPILFQYNSITPVFGMSDDNPWSTVGIESPDQTDGLEICYWNVYNPGAAALSAGRVYYFTTSFNYTPPGSNFTISMIPQGTPIVIPPSGGSLSFDITAANVGSLPASASGWCTVTLPDGSIFGPTLGPILLNLPGSTSVNRFRTQNVPANAPTGSYTYHAYIGQYPGTIYDEDAFPFSKSGDDGSGNWTVGWSNTGESFEELLAPVAAELPRSFALHPAYPNPFNPTTRVSFDLPEAAQVTLTIYDVKGRLVATLAQGYYAAGNHVSVLDAQGLASGIYVVRLQAGNFQQTDKLVLLK